jgi:RNA polymerase sigma-70 factor (ECF subfamily)
MAGMNPLAVEHDPERSVIEAIQQGDSHALGELMERQGGWVRGVIFGVLGRAEDVDDVAQRVWMQVWREAGKLEESSRWRVWLYRIARNAATDAGRRRHRRRKLLTSLVRRHEEIKPVSVSAERPLVDDEQKSTMLQAIAKLPELYREPFVLKHMDGWSYAQIAEAMNLPVDTVETRLVRARRLLRQELTGKV